MTSGGDTMMQQLMSTGRGRNHLVIDQATAHKDGVPPIGHISIPGSVDPAVEECLIEGSPELHIDIRRLVSMRHTTLQARSTVRERPHSMQIYSTASKTATRYQ